MNSKKIRFAIIGMGAISKFHAESINNLERAELVAVSSRSRVKGESAANKYGVDYYSDYNKMLERNDIDVVNICTASGMHLEPAIAAASARKHLIVEKPLEVTLERTDKMLEACSNSGVKLTSIFQSRFNPNYLKLRDAISNGSLGKLVIGSAYIKWFRPQEYYDSAPWRGTIKGDGGAALINQSIHTIDLLLSIMGPVKSLFAKTATMTHNIEGEDVGLVILNFRNGALGLIEGGTSIYPGYPERLEITGENGTIILKGGKVKSWDIKGSEYIQNKKEEHDESGSSSDPMAISLEGHMAQIDDMIDAIYEGREPKINGYEGRKVIELLSAIYESSRTGRSVEL
jgi:predicted dehydrogenase